MSPRRRRRRRLVVCVYARALHASRERQTSERATRGYISNCRERAFVDQTASDAFFSIAFRSCEFLLGNENTRSIHLKCIGLFFVMRVMN